MSHRVLSAFFLVTSMLLFTVQAEAAKSPSGSTKSPSEAEKKSNLDEVFVKYSASQVQMNVERTTKSMLSKKDKKESGEILLSAGKMRWSVSTPAKALIVFDGKNIWSEELSPVDPTQVNVTKSKIEKSAGNLALLNILTGKSKPSKAYNVTKISSAGGAESYLLKPKDKKAAIQDVKIKINIESKTIAQLSYVDDIGNETTLVFSDVNLNAKFNSASFVYTPKSGSKVNEL